MTSPAPGNTYPASPEAFQGEQQVQFADGQQASAFTSPDTVIAWGEHALADPATTEAIMKLHDPQSGNVSTLYVKGGQLIDVEQSERTGRVQSTPLDAAQPATLSKPWPYKFGPPPTVDRVLLRDGQPGQPTDPSRDQKPGMNPFDAMDARVRQVEAAEQRRKQQAASHIGPVAVVGGPPRPASRPDERQRSYWRGR